MRGRSYTDSIHPLSVDRELGVGAGWFAEEIEALGYNFETRGRRMDEMIEVLRRCWTGKPQPFAGDEVFVPEGLIFEPRPSQSGGPQF